LTAALFWRHPRLRITALLALPAIWFVAFYLLALAAMFVSSLHTVDDLSGQILPGWTLANFRILAGDWTYGRIALRTVESWKRCTRSVLSLTSRARARRGSWVVTPTGHRLVWQRCAWMQPTANIIARAAFV